MERSSSRSLAHDICIRRKNIDNTDPDFAFESKILRRQSGFSSIV